MSDDNPNAKKPKINSSVVHAEFKPCRMKHSKTKEWIDGSLCNHCGHEVPGKAPTNLKSHLKAHPEVYDRVIRKFENQLSENLHDLHDVI